MMVDMVNMVTSEKLKEMDWAKSIEICELVASDHGQAKGVIKSIKKRLGNKNGNTQLYAVMLLEMLMNNCGDHIHKQVIDNGLLPILVKIVKKKTYLPVRERIFLLLDATQTSVGGATGKYPQYYAAYYELVAARVQFPNRPKVPPPEPSPPRLQVKNIPAQEPINQIGAVEKPPSQIVTDASVTEKAASVLEILNDVLNAMDPKNPEGASDEFVLDLVEQCSFQKQRIMHLVMTSRDEKMVNQAIELNEQLHKVLVQHDALLSVCAGSKSHFHVNGKEEEKEEEEEEEDEERLYLRLRKGKACVEDYPNGTTKHFRSISDDKVQRPIIRPLCIQDPDSKPLPPPVIIPPPPSKYTEREKFFKEKHMDNTTIDGHMRGLSLDSRNGSSSHSGSTDFSDRDFNGFRDS